MIDVARPSSARTVKDAGPPAAAPPVGYRARRLAQPLTTWIFVGLVFAVLYGPLIALAVFSFNNSTIIALPWSGFTTTWYRQAFAADDLRAALLNSLAIAIVVAPVSLICGTLAAFGLTRFRFRLRGGLAALVWGPLVVPWLVIGIAALLFFAKLNIPLSRGTVIVTQIVCTFPLVAAIVSAQLISFDHAQEEAATDLGASRLQTFRYVILPHILPAVAAAGIFAVTWSFNNFEISYFTLGFQQTFPVWVYSILVHGSNTLPVVNSISTLISVLEVLLILVAWRILRTREGGVSRLIGGGMR